MIMSAELYNLHPITPEKRKLAAITDAINEGAVILYPTDTGFTLGCGIEQKNAIERIRKIRKLSLKHELTFLCDSLSNVAEFAKVSNSAYKLIKRLIPGPYTFILPATKLVPKYAQNPKRKTSGIRVPDNTLTQELLKLLDMPLMSISAKIDIDDEFAYAPDPDEVLDTYINLVDIAVTSDEYDFWGESTILDLTTDDFEVIREGAGFDDVRDYIFEE